MSVALMQYTQAHNGELPNDILQLQQYLKAHVDDLSLQQYQLMHKGRLSDLPAGEWLITEKAPLDEGFDTTFRVGYDRFGVESGGPLEEPLGEFYKDNPGQEPTDFSQLEAYVKTPAGRSALERLTNRP